MAFTNHRRQAITDTDHRISDGGRFPPDKTQNPTPIRYHLGSRIITRRPLMIVCRANGIYLGTTNHTTPDLEETQVGAYASKVGTGAILGHVVGEETTFIFTNRKFCPTDGRKSWTDREREYLAVLCVMMHYRTYLARHRLTLVKYSSVLTYLFESQDLGLQLHR